MKTRVGVRLYPTLAVLALGWSIASLPAQEPPPVVVVGEESPSRTPEQLEQLLGPIALYPDALIALILPASAAPVDIVLAARYLKDGGDPNGTGARAWDESVKSLTHYPDVVKWMDENIEWTKQLGDAFLRQPADVMKAMQRLRERARAAGTLATTPQQVVGYDAGVITIVPAEPNIIYVPRYEPEIVYVSQPVYRPQPFLTFGVGFAVGPWLTHDCDWRTHRVWVVNRQWNWREHRDWRHPIFPGQPGYVSDPHRQPWRPPVNHGPMPVVWHREIQRPTLINGTPTNAPTQPLVTQPAGTSAPRRERNNPPAANRPVNVATTTVPATTTAQTPGTAGASPFVPITQTQANEANEQRNRRTRTAPPATTYRANPATQTPASSTTPDQNSPSTNPPTTQVVGPITRPLVPQATRPVVTPMPATSPTTATVTPQPHTAPARATTAPTQPPQHTAPAARATTPPAQQPQSQQPAQAQPATRDDRDNRRREQP